MQYNQPFDQPDNPNAAYVNGNPATGTQGSIPPAECFEFHQREIVNYIKDNKVTPSNTDLHQLSRGLQNSSVIYGVDSGTANTLVIYLNPIPLTHTPGMTVRVRKGATPNTGSLTLNIGLGADSLLKADGSAFNNGEMPANMMFEATWDGSAWKTINFLGVQSTTENVVNNYTTKIPYCVDTSSTSNTIVAPYSPTITSISAGGIISVKLNKAFTGGPVTILVNAMAAINVKRGDGQNPYSSDGYVGQVLLLEFDGTNFQIVNSLLSAAPLPVLLADIKQSNVATQLTTPVLMGGTFSAGAWRTRDLNTIVADPFGLVALGLVSLSNNRFTLGVGNWIVRAKAPAMGVGFHMLRLWNVTDNVCPIKGTWTTVPNAISQAACDPLTTYSFVDGLVSLSSPKTFELQHVCYSSRAEIGFGYSWNSFPIFQTDPEQYSVVQLTWSR